MFCILSRRGKVKFAVIFAALLFTALAAVVISLCSFGRGGEGSLGYVCDLKETGGAGGFLSQFSLEYERQESTRELTLPMRDDAVFRDYGDFQSSLGFNVLKFSGKRVEERYLKLKNKTQKGETLYAVLYIYKEKVIAAHLTTLAEQSEMLPITAFV